MALPTGTVTTAAPDVRCSRYFIKKKKMALSLIFNYLNEAVQSAFLCKGANQG